MKHVFGLLLAVASSAAFAQAPVAAVGSATDVVGNVTVTANGVTATGRSGVALNNGSTITTGTGRATLRVGNCLVALGSFQSLTVDTSKSCAELQASIRPVANPGPSVAGLGAPTTAGSGGAVAAMAGVSLIGFAAVKEDEVTSP